MSINKRITIGLMTTHLDDEFSKSICRGVIACAEDMDANVIILPGRYIDAVYADKNRTGFEFQYNTIFSYAKMNGIDVIVSLIGAIGSFISTERKKEFLQDFDGVPIITIAAEIDGFTSVCFDNVIGLKEEITHFIKVHNRRRIGFVSGPVTNTDALERLNAYKETLKENGLAFDEELVAYGDFSPYCFEPVRELLKKKPDAVIFANDCMAVSGYEVIKSLGLQIGKDISVGGFDNSPVAAGLTPALTTVHADAVRLGYEAAKVGIKRVASQKSENVKVPSVMVKKMSCGCMNNEETDNSLYRLSARGQISIEAVADELCSYLYENKYNGEIAASKDLFVKFIKTMLGCLENGELSNYSEKDRFAEIIKSLNAFLQAENSDKLNLDKLCSVVMYLQRRSFDFSTAKFGANSMSSLFFNLYKCFTNAVAGWGAKKVEQFDFLTWQSNAILKDMLFYTSYDDSTYGSVSDKLMRLTGMKSSYIYTFQDVPVYTGKTKWIPPSRIYLKSFHNKNQCFIVPREQQEIHINEIFTHSFIPDDRRFTMVLSPVSLNTDHYGLFLCELNDDSFYYINPLITQLSGAMKIIRLIQDKELIQQELENTLSQLQDKNFQLDAISKIDELTCVLNRRGFFSRANGIIHSSSYSGRKAIIIFADINDLKVINDKFSHEDGDFAIRSAADILNDCFRSSDVIGRIGGDEFSVLSLIDEGCNADEISSMIRCRIAEAQNNYNLAHQKPYNIMLSLGMYPFCCSDSVDLNNILSRADALLYSDKKNKVSILRVR